MISQPQPLRVSANRPPARREAKRPRANRGHGLRPRLIAWFEANPGEMPDELTAALKFGVDRRYARNVLSILKAEGLVGKVTGFMLKRGA